MSNATARGHPPGSLAIIWCHRAIPPFRRKGCCHLLVLSFRVQAPPPSSADCPTPYAYQGPTCYRKTPSGDPQRTIFEANACMDLFTARTIDGTTGALIPPNAHPSLSTWIKLITWDPNMARGTYVQCHAPYDAGHTGGSIGLDAPYAPPVERWVCVSKTGPHASGGQCIYGQLEPGFKGASYATHAECVAVPACAS